LRITCDYCLTEYQVQPPPAPAEGSDSRFSFRCSNCGRVFSATHPEPAEVSETPPEPPAEASPPQSAPTDILVRQGEETYSANDMAMVQKWIVERRLNREGVISTDGLSWKSVGELPTLLPFLELVEQVQALEHPVQNRQESRADLGPVPNLEAQFVDVAELESAVLLEPEDTQDGLEIDPFPTEEVPLPPTPISTNLKDFAGPQFEPPNTEEVPFDFPIRGDHTLEAPKIELSPEPGLPRLSHAQDMVDAPGPTFADDPPDFPTEEELLVLAEEEPDSDPLGNALFASVESDWDDGIEDEDLEWINDKKRTRRIVMGLLLVILAGLTGKLILDRKAANTPSTAGTTAGLTTASLEVQAIPQEGELVEIPAEAPPRAESDEISAPPSSGTFQPPATPKADVKQATARKATPKLAAKPAPSSQEAKTQARRAKAAKEAAAKQGPQPKTASDFVDRGRQAINQGDYDTARIHYLEAVFMAPGNAAAQEGLAFAALRQGDQSFAVNHFCKALSLSPPTSSMAKEIQKKLAGLNEECP
jgi:hypothetical protein